MAPDLRRRSSVLLPVEPLGAGDPKVGVLVYPHLSLVITLSHRRC
ncbi:hypothetical protein ACWEOS_31535 [Micromonospora taraxaci]